MDYGVSKELLWWLLNHCITVIQIVLRYAYRIYKK
jgi:hypothetical protein